MGIFFGPRGGSGGDEYDFGFPARRSVNVPNGRETGKKRGTITPSIFYLFWPFSPCFFFFGGRIKDGGWRGGGKRKFGGGSVLRDLDEFVFLAFFSISDYCVTVCGRARTGDSILLRGNCLAS